MKNIVFIGYVIPPEEANNASGVSVAGNKMQWNVVSNLAQTAETSVECVTITPYAAYPHDSRIFHRRKTAMLTERIPYVRVGYCNLPIVKQFWQIITVYVNARRILKRTPDATVLCFNLFPQVGIPIRWLKKEFPHSSMVCLLADLPLDDNTKRKGISSFFRRKFDASTWKSLTVCDKYIVLNKKVAELYLGEKPYIVVDGGVDEDDIQRSLQYEKKTPVEKNILYCGALTEYNGVLNLIEAMKYFKDTDIVCDIYGGGYLEEQVREAARENKNIRFHGRVDNATVMQKQQEAWLLINPRVVDDPIAQVTFPSKTFEYLLSGTPVLTTRLNGYSDEYNELMFFASDDSSRAISSAIVEISDMSQDKMLEMALRAKKFISTNRTWSTQANRIQRFINEEC